MYAYVTLSPVTFHFTITLQLIQVIVVRQYVPVKFHNCCNPNSTRTRMRIRSVYLDKYILFD